MITLVTFIFDSFMLTWFMWGEIWCLNCFILTLFTFIFKHTMLGLCAFTRVCWNPFITLVTFICNPVWLLCLVVHYTLIKLACPADLISQLYAINYFCEWWIYISATLSYQVCLLLKSNPDTQLLLLSKYCNFGYDHTVHIDIWNNFVLGLCLVTVFQL